MPNCFTLTRKGEKAPTPLVKIDEMICAHFGARPDAKVWYFYWMDCIGFPLACGKSLAQIKADFYYRCMDNPDACFVDTRLYYIADYLDDNFTSDCFVQIGK